MSVLVIGGKGYIGSHIVSLLQSCLVLDIDTCDITDKDALDMYFNRYCDDVEYVIHLAGLKSVPESIRNPELYHEVNVIGTSNIINVMKKYRINNILFSSSATVYATDTSEDDLLHANNPYGQSKIDAEELIKNSGLNYAILRYFNPIGSLPELPENYNSPNLFPSCCRALINDVVLNVYGDCTRDYVFVVDLARFHILIIDQGFKNLIINFGTGEGTKTSEFIRMFENSNNVIMNKKLDPSRDGDKPSCIANVTKFKSLYPNFLFTKKDRWFVNYNK